MDKETQKWLAMISISIAAIVILILILSGYELGGFEIHRGIQINKIPISQTRHKNTLRYVTKPHTIQPMTKAQLHLRLGSNFLWTFYFFKSSR